MTTNKDQACPLNFLIPGELIKRQGDMFFLLSERGSERGGRVGRVG